MPSTPASDKRPFTAWHGLLLAEGAAAMTGLPMPLAPTRTGSGRGMARLYLDDPGYRPEALAYLSMTNLLLARSPCSPGSRRVCASSVAMADVSAPAGVRRAPRVTAIVEGLRRTAAAARRMPARRVAAARMPPRWS